MTEQEKAILELTELVKLLRAQVGQPQQEWFSIKQAAALTGLSESHVRRAVVGGCLPASNVGTNDRPTYRLSRADILEWMEKRKAGAFPPVRKRQQRARVIPYSPHRRPSKYASSETG